MRYFQSFSGDFWAAVVAGEDHDVVSRHFDLKSRSDK